MAIWLAVEVLSTSLICYRVFGLNVDVVTLRTSSSPKSQHLFFLTLERSADGKQLSGPLLFIVVTKLLKRKNMKYHHSFGLQCKKRCSLSML